MILNKCFLYVNGFPLNAGDIPYDVLIDWGDGSSAEKHERLYADVLPAFTHIYEDSEVHDITVQVKNACGQATQTVAYSPYISYEVACNIVNTFSQMNAITDIADPFTMSVSSYVADLHKTSAGVNMKVVVDAACSLPYVSYPKKYNQYYDNRFAVSSDRLTAEDAVLNKGVSVNNSSPYAAFTTIKGDPANLIYEFPRQHISKVTLVGDYNLTQRLSYIDPDSNAPTLYTWTQSGGRYTLELTSTNWANKDRIIIYLQEGEDASLYSITITNAENAVIAKNSILVIAEVFWTHASSESVMTHGGQHGYIYSNGWSDYDSSEYYSTQFRSGTSPRTFIPLTLTFYSHTAGLPQYLKFDLATSCPAGETLYLSRIDDSENYVNDPYATFTGSQSTSYNYANRVDHTVYMEYIPDKIGKHTIMLVFASDPAGTNGEISGRAFFRNATYSTGDSSKIAAGISGKLIFTNQTAEPISRITILCDDNAKARLQNQVNYWTGEDIGGDAPVNKGVIELNGDPINEYVFNFDGSAGDGKIYGVAFWYEAEETRYDSAIVVNYAVADIPNTPENLSYYTETNGTNHCVLVSSLFFPNNRIPSLTTDTAVSINVDLMFESGTIASTFTGNWEASCLMSIINTLPVESS